jgi:ABC-type branched-subunit amino acid transport system ATPase component
VSGPHDVPAPEEVRAVGLVKRFGGFVAVDHVDLTLGAGGIMALIGPNGAGKTTLFNLITGQLAPDEGQIFIGDREVTGKQPHQMARLGFGRSFQDVRLFGELSVLANVMVYAQPRETASMLRTLTRPMRQRGFSREARVAAEGVLDYLKIGHLRDTEAGSLGFAQQKLVAIARLLALKPRMLLLDEPASGLDEHGRETLVATIEQLGRDGYSVCFVEHNTHLVRRLANHVVFIAQGKTLAEGPPEEVFSSSALAEAYLGIP